MNNIRWIRRTAELERRHLIWRASHCSSTGRRENAVREKWFLLCCSEATQWKFVAAGIRQEFERSMVYCNNSGGLAKPLGTAANRRKFGRICQSICVRVAFTGQSHLVSRLSATRSPTARDLRKKFNRGSAIDQESTRCRQIEGRL
jgi:hypothetical protein